MFTEVPWLEDYRNPKNGDQQVSGCLECWIMPSWQVALHVIASMVAIQDNEDEATKLINVR